MPTKLKALRGNPGQRRLNTREPIVQPAVPDPPDWLSAEAQEKYAEVATALGNVGIVTHIDADILTLYSATWVEWKRATQASLDRGLTVVSGKGEERTAPHVLVAGKSLMQLRALAAELGMSPSSRSRVKAVPPPTRRPSKWKGILVD